MVSFLVLIPSEFIIKVYNPKKVIFHDLIDFEPGDYVRNPTNKNWGIGQVQSIIGNKVTVNFENYGKRVINVENINLEKVINEIK